MTCPWAPAAQQGSRPGGRVAASQEWPSGLCGSPATRTSLPHPAQHSRVTQESLRLHPLGAACWPRALPVHALPTPGHSGQPPLIRQSASAVEGGGAEGAERGRQPARRWVSPRLQAHWATILPLL